MLDWFTNESWMAWGIGLLIGFPLLTILFGEMLYRLEGDKKERKAFLGNTQYFVLPSLVIYLLLTQVIDLDSSDVLVRLASTTLWISILYLFMSVFNMFWEKRQQDNSWQSKVPKLILNIGRLFFILLGIAIIMSVVWGIDLGKMLAALGVGSIVLGLALQDTLGGLFAGITLISARQFQIGDWLKTGDVVGRVITVNWHSVTLCTFENDLLVIPNSVLATGTFYNYSRPDRVHMERIVIQFCEEHPPNLVRKALLEAAKNAPGVLDNPAPQIVLTEIADDAGAYEAQIWFEDYKDIDEVRDAYITSAWYAAKRYGIVFPFEDHQMFYFDGSEMNLGNIDTILPTDLEDKLQQLGAFSSSEAERKTIAENSTILRFGEGEEILQAGKETEHVYVVLTGSIQSYVTDIKGKKHTLGVTLPGSYFGILAGLRHIESLVTVVAHHDLQVAKIPVDTIEDLIRTSPAFGQSLELEMENSLKTVNSIRFKGQKGRSREMSVVMDKHGKQVVSLREILKKKGHSA